MPKILITGNGFDLNQRLPTLYANFIRIIQFVKDNAESEIVFDKVYQKGQKDKFKEFDINKENVVEIKNLAKDSTWFNFFEKELKIETWIDFEQKIEYVLEGILGFNKLIKKKIYDRKINNIRPFQVVLTQEESINNELLELLKLIKIVEESSANNILYIKYDFIKVKYEEVVAFDLEEVLTFLLKELNIFKDIFRLYFETFVYPFYDGLKGDTTFSKINYHFTFNYTPTFDKLFNKGKIKTQYLHGKINEGFQNTVLGINEIPDEFNLYKKSFFRFTKYFQKLDQNTDYRFLNYIKGRNTKDMKEEFQFFIFGHSLDKSDKLYIDEIFSFIFSLEERNKNKIVISYYDEADKSKLLLNLLDIVGREGIERLMKKDCLIFVDQNSEKYQGLLISGLRTYRGTASIKL